MATFSNQDLKSMYKLLSDRQLTFTGIVSDDMKCGICKNILIDAQLTSCRCSFCRKCIESYRSEGGNCCPGNNDECRDSDLLNILLDSKINRQISRLIVRCDEDNCDFQCKLVDMMTHLENCSKKRFNCLFSIIGCEVQLNGDEINPHLKKESYSHSKLLMEMINNLKNEINELRNNDVNNKNDISILKETVNGNISDISILKEDRDGKKMKSDIRNKDMESLDEEMKIFKEELLNENEERFKIIMKMIQDSNDNYSKEIEELKDDMMKREKCESVKNEIECLRTEIKTSEESMKIILSNVISLKDEKFDLINDEMNLVKKEVEDMRTKSTDCVKLITRDIKKIQKELEDMKENFDLLKKEIYFINEEVSKIEKIKDDYKNEIKELVSVMNEKSKMEDPESKEFQPWSFTKAMKSIAHRHSRKELDKDFSFKLVLLGDSAVGKSSLFYRYTEGTFSDNCSITNSSAFKSKTLNLDGKTIKLKIWDTPGKGDYKNLIPVVCKSSHGIIIVYDVTNRESFENVNKWIVEMERGSCEKNVRKLLVGNKIDLKRVIDRSTGEEYSRKLNISFMETSTKESINVDKAFLSLCREILFTFKS